MSSNEELREKIDIMKRNNPEEYFKMLSAAKLEKKKAKLGNDIKTTTKINYNDFPGTKGTYLKDLGDIFVTIFDTSLVQDGELPFILNMYYGSWNEIYPKIHKDEPELSFFNKKTYGSLSETKNNNNSNVQTFPSIDFKFESLDKWITIVQAKDVDGISFDNNNDNKTEGGYTIRKNKTRKHRK